MNDPRVPLRYGRINPAAGFECSRPVPMAATQAIGEPSAKFVYMSAGAATLCDDPTTSIYGYLETYGGYTPSTGKIINCDIDANALFCVPITAGTLVVGMIGDSVDLDILAGIQGIDLTASVRDLLIVVDGDFVGNKYAIVKMNQAHWGTGLGVDA